MVYRPPWKKITAVVIIYVGLVLLFTLLGVVIGPESAQVGGTRPDETIPGHLAELAGFGLLLGGGSAAIYGRKGVHLIVLVPILTVSLDLDHLPAYLGYAETIRPAHSLVFVVVAFAATAITIKAVDLDLVVVSAFMGHMAVDTGLFAPFSPLSFQYYSLDPYRLAFAVGAILCALAAGVVLRRGYRTVSLGGRGDV